MKKARLPASELLQNAVRAEVKRREQLAESDRYVAELKAEVGEPTARQRARARAVAEQMIRRRRRKVG